MSCDTSLSRTGGSSWPTSRFSVGFFLWMCHMTLVMWHIRNFSLLKKTVRCSRNIQNKLQVSWGVIMLNTTHLYLKKTYLTPTLNVASYVCYHLTHFEVSLSMLTSSRQSSRLLTLTFWHLVSDLCLESLGATVDRHCPWHHPTYNCRHLALHRNKTTVANQRRIS